MQLLTSVNKFKNEHVLTFKKNVNLFFIVKFVVKFILKFISISLLFILLLITLLVIVFVPINNFFDFIHFVHHFSKYLYSRLLRVVLNEVCLYLHSSRCIRTDGSLAQSGRDQRRSATISGFCVFAGAQVNPFLPFLHV